MNNKVKSICLGVLCSILLISLIITSILMIKDMESDKNTFSNKIYGTVFETGTNYIKIKTVDGDNYILFTKDKVEEGDFVLAEYDKASDEIIKNAKIDVIAKDDEITIIDEIDENDITSKVTTTESTTTESTTTSRTTTSKATTTYVRVNTTTTTTNDFYSDDDIISYYSREYNYVTSNYNEPSFREKVKEKFISAVDFIFYEKEINGMTFNKLKTTTKAKVLYYTLMMDNKIDEIFPNYKVTLGEKYNDIKAKLIAKYMDIVTSVCKDNERNCAYVRSDFELLKTSTKLTWDIIKKAFSYAYDNGTKRLVEWYETFSGKR